MKVMRPVITSTSVPYLQMRSVGSHSASTREKEAKEGKYGVGPIQLCPFIVEETANRKQILHTYGTERLELYLRRIYILPQPSILKTFRICCCSNNSLEMAIPKNAQICHCPIRSKY